MCAILSSAAITGLTSFIEVAEAPESYGILKEAFYFIKDSGPTLKIIVLLLGAPIWFPVARLLMREINAAWAALTRVQRSELHGPSSQGSNQSSSAYSSRRPKISSAGPYIFG